MYYILDKRWAVVDKRDSAKRVAAFLLGMRLSDLVIIKSDEKGDRMYHPGVTDGDVFKIEQELEVL